LLRVLGKTWRNAYVHIALHTHVHKCTLHSVHHMHKCTPTQSHVYVYMHTHPRMHTHTLPMCICTCTHMHANVCGRTHTCREPLRTLTQAHFLLVRDNTVLPRELAALSTSEIPAPSALREAALLSYGIHASRKANVPGHWVALVLRPFHVPHRATCFLPVGVGTSTKHLGKLLSPTRDWLLKHWVPLGKWRDFCSTSGVK
jgi:hypothetical protein